MATNSTNEEQSDIGGALIDGEVRVVGNHRLAIHRRTRGSGKKKYLTRCSAYCRCGESSPFFPLNEQLDNWIKEHVE